MISRRHFLRFAAGLGAFGASTTAYGFAVEPVLRLRVARYDLLPPQWPAGFDLKIAVVADLHACDPWMSLQHIEAIVDRTNALHADVIVMLGDYVAGHRHVTRYIPAREWAPVLAGLKAPLGVHAILGNHDWWEDQAVQREGRGLTVARRALEDVGIPVYENDAARLTKAGRPFWLAGLGDQLAYLPARRFRPVKRIGVDDLAATLSKVTDDAPVVLLAHEPDVAMRVPARVALQLSGHTHGGQLRLFEWSPVVPSRYGNRLAYGHTRTNCDVVVSGGLGCSHAVPPRRPAGNRAGEIGRVRSGHFMTGEFQSVNDYVPDHLSTTPMDVLSFWFSEESRPKWFATDPSFDAAVSARYGEVLQAAKRGELFQWRETIRGRLAEIIVLDQFSRNIHRGTPAAFECDAQALALAQEAVRDRTRLELTPDEKAFLYMPFMHSESLVIHEEGLKLFSETGLEWHLAYEEEHRRVIKRFGRYPHRNAILGRASTAEEELYLAQDQDL